MWKFWSLHTLCAHAEELVGCLLAYAQLCQPRPCGSGPSGWAKVVGCGQPAQTVGLAAGVVVPLQKGPGVLGHDVLSTVRLFALSSGA